MIEGDPKVFKGQYDIRSAELLTGKAQIMNKSIEVKNQDWYKDQKNQWDRLRSEGWVFENPLCTVDGMFGVTMKMGETTVVLLASRNLSFYESHTKILSLAMAIASA